MRTGHVAKARADAAKAGNRTRNRRRENMDQTPGRLCWFAWKMNAQLVLCPDIRVDDRKAGKIVGAAGFFDNSIGVFQHFFDSHRVHLAPIVIARLNGVLQVASGRLRSQIVGNDIAGAPLVLDPGDVGHGDPDRLVIDGKADVSRVGVASSDGDDGPLPLAVEFFPGPAVGHFKVFIHD